jgi:thymidylate synthase
MQQYNELITRIIETGTSTKNERTGETTRAVFGATLRFNLQEFFPIVDSKLTHWKKAIVETLWYLQGTGDTSFLKENGVNIWDAWCVPGTLDLKRVYGVQWRKWRKYSVENTQDITQHDDGSITHLNAKVKVQEIDQVAQLIEKIKKNPSDRRMIVTAWNPAELDEMQLPPCHMTWIVRVLDGKVNMHLTQRSCDVGIGLPWNLVCYATLCHMIAHVTGLQVGEFVWNGVDVHLYENHVEKLKEMVAQYPEGGYNSSPKLEIVGEVENIDSFTKDNFKVTGYNCGKFLPLPVAV